MTDDDPRLDATVKTIAIFAESLVGNLQRAAAPAATDAEREAALVSALDQGAKVHYGLAMISDLRPDLGRRAEKIGDMIAGRFSEVEDE